MTLVFLLEERSMRQEERTFRAPDRLGTPSAQLRKLVPAFQKVEGARKMGRLLSIDNARSPSFSHFVQGVKRLVAHADT